MTLVCRLLALAFVMLLLSCRREAQYVTLTNKRTFAFAKEVYESDNLVMYGYGGGFWERINNLSVYYISPLRPDMDEARRLYVEIATRYLDAINQDESLRPYLNVYPMTFNELELMIVFDPIDTLQEPFISAVSQGDVPTNNCRRDFLMFIEIDPVTNKETVIPENFQKSLEILRYQAHCRAMEEELKQSQI